MMRPACRLILLFVAFGCGTGACQSSVSEEDLVPAVAEELCNLQQRCECEGSPSGEECQSLAEQVIKGFLLPPPGAGLTYDAACAGELVDAYADFECDALDAFADDRECRFCKPYHGDKQAGDACSRFEGTIFDDCGPGLGCFEDVCIDPCETVGEGEPCLGRQCSEGLVCTYSFDDETSTCQSSAGLGDSCEDAICADDLVCNSATFACAEAPGVGEPCMGASSCDDGSWCDTSDSDIMSWVCRAPKDDGEPCMSGDECSSKSCDFDAKLCVELRPLLCEILN